MAITEQRAQTYAKATANLMKHRCDVTGMRWQAQADELRRAAAAAARAGNTAMLGSWFKMGAISKGNAS